MREWRFWKTRSPIAGRVSLLAIRFAGRSLANNWRRLRDDYCGTVYIDVVMELCDTDGKVSWLAPLFVDHMWLSYYCFYTASIHIKVVRTVWRTVP